GKDSLLRESRQRNAHGCLFDHLLDRHRLALHGNRTVAEVHGLAGKLLALSRRHARGLWGSDASRKNLALSPLQHYRLNQLKYKLFSAHAVAAHAMSFRSAPRSKTSCLQPPRPGRAQRRSLGGGDRGAQFAQEALLIRAERSFQDQPVRSVIAAKDRALQLEPREKRLHLLHEPDHAERLPLGEVLAKARLAQWEAHGERRQKFWLRRVHQRSGVFRVLAR